MSGLVFDVSAVSNIPRLEHSLPNFPFMVVVESTS
jgi:hypothetical protein